MLQHFQVRGYTACSVSLHTPTLHCKFNLVKEQLFSFFLFLNIVVLFKKHIGCTLLCLWSEIGKSGLSKNQYLIEVLSYHVLFKKNFILPVTKK